jgi:hypothetical protein
MHAKLIAAISGSTAHVLSGSANLSYVALQAAAAQGNVEAAVVASHDADSARALFTPPGLGLRRLEVGSLCFPHARTPGGGHRTAAPVVAM